MEGNTPDSPQPKKRRKRVRLENQLSEQELIFVREYCRDFNATRAVLAAGITDNYASARVRGGELVANRNIIKLISEITEEFRQLHKIDIQGILYEWSIVARSDIENYRLNKQGEVETKEGVPEVARRAVKSKKYTVTSTVETTPQGNEKKTKKVFGEIELQDKFKAQKALYDHFRMVEDRDAGKPDPVASATVGAELLVRLGAILQAGQPAPGGAGGTVPADQPTSPVDAVPRPPIDGVPDAS